MSGTPSPEVTVSLAPPSQREASFQVFRQLPGLWRVVKAAENTPAQAFWRRIIAGFTEGDYHEQILNGPEWFGLLQEFVSGG